MKLNHLFKTISAESVACECSVITEEAISLVKALHNIKIIDGDFRLGRGSDRFDLKFGFLDTSRYGLKLSSFFGTIKAEGSLNGKSFLFSDSHSPFEKIKKTSSPLEPVPNVPLVVKHGIHEFLSSSLIRSNREIEFQIDTETLLKVCVFLNLPFVFAPNSNVKRPKGSADSSRSLSFKMAFAPGKKYNFSVRMGWDDFALPRFVADDVGEDQFCVFLPRLIKSRPSYEMQLNVFYGYGQEIKSDRAADVLAFLKIVNSIFSIDSDELY